MDAVARVARDQRRLGIEGAQAARGLLAEVAGADHQHPLALKLVGRVMVPLAPILVADEGRELPQAREDRGQHPFGGRATVDAAGVAQDHAVRDQSDQLVNAGVERLDDAQPRHRLEPLQSAKPFGGNPELGPLDPLGRRAGSIPGEHLDPIGKRAREAHPR